MRFARTQRGADIGEHEALRRGLSEHALCREQPHDPVQRAGFAAGLAGQVGDPKLAASEVVGDRKVDHDMQGLRNRKSEAEANDLIRRTCHGMSLAIGRIIACWPSWSDRRPPRKFQFAVGQGAVDALDAADVYVVDDVAGTRVDLDRPPRAFPLHALHRCDESVAVGLAAGLLERLEDEVHGVIAADRDKIRAFAIGLLVVGHIGFVERGRRWPSSGAR